MNSKTDEILSHLRSKNRCLENLLDATQRFLSLPIEELAENAIDRTVDPLAVYERERTSSLKALDLYDRKINEMISALSSDSLPSSFQSAAKNELLTNEKLINAIFKADDVVFEKIQTAQSRLSKIMQETRKGKETLSKFKSISESGNSVDQKL